MFKETTNQSSLFDAEIYLPDALPENDWSFTFRDKILHLIDENKFRALYSEKEGRPNASIKIMVSILIFIGLEKLTWRAAEFQYSRRIDWLIATHTEVGKASIDHRSSYVNRLVVENYWT